MKSRERFNKILLACRDRIQDEVAALIGKPFKIGEAEFRVTSKEELFADVDGKQALARVRLEGDVQGSGCLLVSVKDAIYIGGTLIMLPESELASVLAEQQYSEELQDSYGEVANIICGAATVTFEEMYPKSVRLIRTEQEVVVPLKVEVESDQPIADVPYYLMTAPMQLGSHELGNVHLALPAGPFGLVAEAPKEHLSPQSAEEKIAEQAVTGVQAETGEAPERQAADSAAAEAGADDRPENRAAAAGEHAAPSQPKRDIGKQKKLIDGLLKSCMTKMGSEVSALLGGVLEVTPTENLAVTKEGFIEQAGGKQIMTRMELRGGGQGEAYLFVDLKTAVYLGGCLIMLPESELEETVRNEDFSEDARDAYGEVTNIVAGVFTSVFEEQSRLKLGFVKTAVEPVSPAKIDPEADEVFANQAYYLSLGEMRYNERDLGRLQLLVPARVLELEGLLAHGEEEAPSGGETATTATATAPSGKAPAAPSGPAPLREKTAESVDVLIFTDDDPEAGRIANALEVAGYAYRILHFKDPVNTMLTSRIQMIFLVMQEVSEQGFGMAIKISSAGLPVPLVAAGPAWTRTLVLKAVKYGACDILITPSSPGDIREKIENNLVKKAA